MQAKPSASRRRKRRNVDVWREKPTASHAIGTTSLASGLDSGRCESQSKSCDARSVRQGRTLSARTAGGRDERRRGGRGSRRLPQTRTSSVSSSRTSRQAVNTRPNGGRVLIAVSPVRANASACGRGRGLGVPTASRTDLGEVLTARPDSPGASVARPRPSSAASRVPHVTAVSGFVYVRPPRVSVHFVELPVA